MLPHSLSKFGAENYDQDEPRFSGFCSRNNIPKIKSDA